MSLLIRLAEESDRAAILDIYKTAAADRAGIIRRVNEVDEEYIHDFSTAAADNGLQLIATEGGSIVGEIHAYTTSIFSFQHLLTYLTIVVAPEAPGRGIGRFLFQTFLDLVKRDFLQH